MKLNGGGSIVNIGSMWAKQAVKATPSYSMQKSRLTLFTQHLAMELADYNIRVNAVSPSSKYYIVSRRFLAEKKQPKRHLKDLMAFIQ
jgi:NAD(P)-dependent dehydrogenase (short-subunit alcohol dehydrogenase family)